jgi:hypothetical protein
MKPTRLKHFRDTTVLRPPKENGWLSRGIDARLRACRDLNSPRPSTSGRSNGRTNVSSAGRRASSGRLGTVEHLGENGQAATMVVTDVAATEGLLANWAHGISIYPVVPLPAQIELVRQGWVEPMTFSPRAVRYMGLAGQP